MTKQISSFSQCLIISSILGVSWLPLGLSPAQLSHTKDFQLETSTDAPLRSWEAKGELGSPLPEPRPKATPEAKPQPTPPPKATPAGNYYRSRD